MFKIEQDDLKLFGRYVLVFTVLAVPVAFCWVEFQLFKLKKKFE